jgi:hypothetical protein
LVSVPVTQLLVGDVVVPEEEGEYVFWFGCLLAGGLELTVQGPKAEERKLPFHHVSDLREARWEKHFIAPFSRTERAQLKESHRLVVTEHDSISKKWWTQAGTSFAGWGGPSRCSSVPRAPRSRRPPRTSSTSQ